MSTATPPPLSKALNLAKRWVAESGSAVERAVGVLPDETEDALLIIDKQALAVAVRDSGRRLVLFVQIPLPNELQRKLAGAEENDRMEFMVNLRAQVTSNPRVGFQFRPPSARSAEEIQQVVLDRGVRVSEADLSSYDRFFDAITEVRTAAVRVAWLFGLGGATPKAQAGYTASTPPPPDIYR